MIDYTTVIGVDAGHLEQLRLVWPTWAAYKPSLLSRPLVVFCDGSLAYDGATDIVGDHHDATFYSWPWPGIEYYGDPQTKWFHPQRYKMLAGFVHVPPRTVRTEYWLKLDLDVVATPGHDDWIDEGWFESSPAMVTHPWGYTKPADQMLKLDEWVAMSTPNFLDGHPPLKLAPQPGSSLVRHKRIISWCGFFNTAFTADCSILANAKCGMGKLPVPSQDGYLWYCARRSGQVIRTANMKARGWVHCANTAAIRRTIDSTVRLV